MIIVGNYAEDWKRLKKMKNFYEQSLKLGLISVDHNGTLRRDIIKTLKTIGKDKFKKLIKQKDKQK